MRRISLILFATLFGFSFLEAQINNNFNVVPWPAVYDADSDWGDYNNDGKIDVLVSGALQGGFPITRIYRNDGGNTFTYETKAQFKGLSKCAVKWGDYNKDGNLDLAVCGKDTLLNTVSRIYKNNGDSTFTWLDQLELTAFSDGSVAWSDIDRDGDLDLFLTGNAPVSGRVFRIYENLEEDQFTEITGHNLPGVSYGDIDFADLNKDGFPDIALAGYSMNNPVAEIYLNTGANSFTPLSAGLKQTHYASIEFSDYDRDGDYDLLLAGQADSIGLWLYTNTDNTFEISALDNFGISRGDICWGEYDNDGYPDVLIGGMDKTYTYHGEVYKNNQDGTFTQQPDFINDFINGSIDWVDYSNDGDMDAFVAGSNFGRMFVNNIVTKNTDPLPPENLNAVIGDTTITFTWSPASDDLTPSTSLTYNLIFGSEGDTGRYVYPHAAINTGFLKTVEHGNSGMDTTFVVQKPLSGSYIWSVQTVDNGFRSSEFAGFQALNIEVNPPDVQTSQLTVVINSADSTGIRFTKGNGEQRILFMAEGEVVPALPTDNTYYAPDNIFGNGDAIEGSGFYCIYSGPEDSVLVTGLTAEQIYTVFALEFNGDAGKEKYLTTLSSENLLEFTTDLFRTLIPDSIVPTFYGRNLWADLDNDNDMDLLTYGQQAIYGIRLSVYLNDDTKFQEKETGLPAFMDGDVALADLDGDNDVDILISGATDDDYLQVFLNDGAANFSRFEGVDIPTTLYGEMSVLDYNRDGRVDLIVTGFSILDGEKITKVYQNLGGAEFTEDQQIVMTPVSQSTVSLCDVNADGYTDILLTGESTPNVPLTELYLNRAGVSFELQTGSGIDNFLEGKSDWGDMDEDGDPDLLITGLVGLEPQVRKSCIYTNDGSGNFTEYLNLSGMEISNGDVKWTDFNQDGRLDIILSGERSYDDRIAAFYSQNDENNFIQAENVWVKPLDYTSIAISDFDNDGDNDVFISGMEAQNSPVCYLMENKTQKTNLPPSVPEELDFVQSNEKIILSWDPSTDDYNSVYGLNYNVFVQAEGSDSYTVSSVTGLNGFQRTFNVHNCGIGQNYIIVDSLEPGNYTWAVQALDASGKYSDFSPVSYFLKKYTQTIQFDSIYPVDYGAESFSVSAASSLGLEIDLTSSDESIASIGETMTVEPQLAGSCTITASQTGNDTVLAAEPVSRIVQVNSTLPVVNTLEYEVLESGDIIVYGQLVSHGGEPEAARGVCYGNTGSPDLSGSFISSGTGEGDFQATIESGAYEEQVFFRTFATNGRGTSFGEEYSYLVSNLDELNIPEISIYPNPGMGMINIIHDQAFEGGVVKVIDSNQNLVSVIRNFFPDDTEIDISHLPNGVYFIFIECEGKIAYRAKYILNRTY